ncbi:gamma-glutamyltransferase [Maribacter algarum]|uniref:Glutathione hydrolase proenzyme n=1 Tax=Maribacter algarum (ex Zhang et al. 2020) TaxID=2578118 RepID=A0A5S3PTC2_9FLAO|nr:gamma-glutamyltransferase [Maribacter algarum]TMM55930.1 gamma-glutamyltransferase [Maribacter algarum]
MTFLKPVLKSILLTLLIAFTASLNAQTHSKNGMVVSSDKSSSAVGAAILKKGGNAIDAAIATAFSLAVTHPSAGNIGGGGFIVFMNSEGKTTTIDFREKAPLSATNDMYLDQEGKLIDGINHFSAKAIGVPGTVAGLFLAHEKYGKLPWKDLLQPAIDQAKNGFAFNWSLYNAANYFTKEGNTNPFMDSYFRNESGGVTQPDEIWKQTELAETLIRIRDKGRDGFYKGKTAKMIASFMKKNDGIITKKDLAKYEAIERQPIKGSYKGYDIYSMPPPSSGGVALVEMMNLMELADLKTMEFNSSEHLHLVAEAMRRAFADRAEHLGDPDFNLNIPLDKLTSKEFAKKRFQGIDMTRASVSDSTKYGRLYDGENTTHLSTMDKDGNAVSLTYTLEYSFGSQMGSKELGFIFNNEMGDFNPQPGITKSNGQIGTAPNLVEPEKRMLSSMTPTIVGKNGKPYLVIGSPGGRTIINTVFQTVLNVLEFEMPVNKAIEALKIHHQWLPDQIVYEKYLLSPDTKKSLEAKGHTLKERNNMGALMGITYDPEKKIFTGASDSSQPDSGAVGY